MRTKTILLLLALLCAVVQGAWADDVTIITTSSKILYTGTYTVNSDVSMPDFDETRRIIISGKVTLNLGEGTTFYVPGGIQVSAGNELTINGPGTLLIDNCEGPNAGIGGSYSGNVGKIVINGGTINVTGGNTGAGIGGSNSSISYGTIIINGGVVNARGGSNAAGIGGGAGVQSENNHDSRWGGCGDITINGGQVSAYGGLDAPGIGPGYDGPASGSLTIRWTNPEDFVYSTGYFANNASSSSVNSINFGNAFKIDGTETIYEGNMQISDGNTTLDKIRNLGGQKIVPYFAEQATFEGEGTEGTPWLIKTDDDWNALALNVLFGNSYAGQYVKLMADIEITKGLGRKNSPFSGTFLGNGHTITANISNTVSGDDANVQGVAPFHYINGATIKNLKVAGTIASASKYTSGLVGFAEGTNLIEGCVVAATLNISSNYAGGIVGHGQNSNTTIRGCVFAGTINGVDGDRANIGGIWGWGDSGTPTLKDCLEAGTYTNIASMHPMGLLSNKGTITNCYFVTWQIGSPTNVCSVNGAALASALTTSTNLGALVQDYGMMTAYENGILFAGTYYESIPRLPGSGTESDPYIIGNNDGWNLFSTIVNSGTNNYSGKFVKLTADIGITNPVGSRVSDSDNKPFSGTFLGDGHTITATLDNDGRQCLAPFRYIKDATIRDLTVAGTITTNQRYSSGLVGFADGTNLIEGCKVTVTLSISGSYAGGFVGHGLSSTTTIRNCVCAGSFDGKVYDIQYGYSYPDHFGFFWGWSDNATVTLENCIEIASYSDDVYSLHPMGWLRGNGTVKNCYYKNEPLKYEGNAWTHTSNSDYGRVYNEPSATEICKQITINGTMVYSHGCTYVVREHYTVNETITPIVTEPLSNVNLTLGTHYTVTVDGVAVTEFPVSYSTAGSHTMVITGTGIYSGSKSFTFTIGQALAGEGTEENPYLIRDAYDWVIFTTFVNDGNNYSGKYVKLTNDIAVSTMAGASESNSFQGIFDGGGHTLTFTHGTAESAFNEDCCAPFRYVKNATIQNLKVAGDIYTSRKFAAGLVARPYGTTSITGCHVSTVIHSSVDNDDDHDGTHGGIVAMLYGTTNISGCAYTGRLLTNNGTNKCGGFVGWHNAQTINVSNSLYAPSGNIAGGWWSINAGATFVRGGSPTITNCYYTETMGDAQGRQAYALATTANNLGNLVQDYGLVTAYANGILCDGKYYMYPMLAGSGTESDPYTISNNDEWNIFTIMVNNHIDNCSGKFVKLTADISGTTMAGNSTSNPFQGIFDGGGHTLTFNHGTAGSAFNEEYCAPFRYVNGATIKNLKVAGNIYTSKKYAAGLVASPYGTTSITGCYVSTVIHNSYGNECYHGGIVSMPGGSLTIEGCAYTGRLLTDRLTNNCGGFVGSQNGATISVSNSLYAPSGNIAGGWSSINHQFTSTFVNKGSATISNCYYTETLGTVQGTLVGIYTTAPDNIGTLEKDYGLVQAYANGLFCDGKYYMYPTLAGSGAETDPYIIGNNDEWISFSTIVNKGVDNCSGKFVKLTADITVSTMVGTSEGTSFKGTFDGNGCTLTFNCGNAESAFNEEYCAPFRYVNGATIKDLKVKGDIYTSNQFAAGLVASPYGTTNITDCHVSTVIHSSVKGDGTHGGIVARLFGTTNISNCVYAGRMFTSNGTTNCGGLVGGFNNQTITFTNSLYAPDPNIQPAANEVPITEECATIVRGIKAVAGCYYTETMGTAQGSQLYTAPPADGIYTQITAADGNSYYAVCAISGVDEYYQWTGSAISVTPIVTCGTTLIADADYTCTFSPAPVQAAGEYTLTITGKGNYSGEKTCQFKVLAPLSGSGTSSENPYIISSADDWIYFCMDVNNGKERYSGKFVKLTADITVSEMVGTSEDNSFQGNFLGDGNHTLTFNRGTAASAFNEEYCAPFRYVKEATIRNLKVAGDIYTSRKFAAGLVAIPYGTRQTIISDCKVSTVIYSTVNGDGTHGGIVSRLGDSTMDITGCVYNGRLLTNNGTEDCGGFVGWWDSRPVNVSNSLYAPDVNIPEGWSSIIAKATFVRSDGNPTITNCYYTETMGTAQGTQVYSTLPDDEICKILTISSVTVYMMPVCTVSGVEDSYLQGEASITPAVTYNGNALTFGTDYTAKLDGESVASFPVSPDKIGINTLILTGTGDYAGTKTIEFTLLPSSTGDITFTDADTYTFMADVNVGSATYTKTLGEERVGKHQAWFVPFDYTITAADEEKFTFYKINMIANSPDPGQEANGDIWMFVKKMDAGDVLHANMPYVYKPKEAVTDYKFTTANAVLKAKANDARITMMTAEDTYTLYGTYEPTTATAADPFYYMNIGGSLSLGNAVTVGAFRWIMRVESKFGSSQSAAYVRQIVIFDGEDETTGICSLTPDPSPNGEGSDYWYTLDGRKLQGTPTRVGMYINNGVKRVIK